MGEVPDTARTIHKRIAPFLPKQMKRPRGPGEFARDEDTWDILECNPRMRFCRYFEGGFFLPHQDGKYVKDARSESLWTVNIYLNGGFEGGHTNFLKEHYADVSE